jgi:DnaJ-class molecular chaperone
VDEKQIKNEELKQRIRRRLYQMNAGVKDGFLADHFMTCPDCNGRGHGCREYQIDGQEIAEMFVCPLCNGDKFIESPTD